MQEDTHLAAESNAIAANDSFQYRLDPARQLTLDGGEEPLLERVLGRVGELVEVVDPEQAEYEAQASLFGWPEPELPFHESVDGKVHPDCLRGWVAKVDAHAKELEVRMLPECCGLQACECSKPANDAERSRDLWDGTKAKPDPDKRPRAQLGLRHDLGAASLGVLVVTLPPRLRPAKGEAKAKLKKWERAAVRVLEETLREKAGVPDAEFSVHAYIHPCGEDVRRWHPHLNFLVPAFYWSESQGRAKAFAPFLDLERLRQRLKEAQVRVFGEAAKESVGNCDWRYPPDEASKRHQAAYVPRTFPRWSFLKLRPAKYGLAHPKNRKRLLDARHSLLKKGAPLSKWESTPPDRLRDGLCSVPLSGRSKTERGAREQLDYLFERHRDTCWACASISPEHRRIMDVQAAPRGPAPPSTGPPWSPWASEATSLPTC